MSLPKVVVCLAVVPIVGLACQSPSRLSSPSHLRRTPVAVTPPLECVAPVVASPTCSVSDQASGVSVCPRDLVRWARDGRTEEQILQALEDRRASLTLTAADENLLRDAGVSESLIEAIKVSSQR